MIQKISKGVSFLGLIIYLLASVGSSGTTRPRVAIVGGTLDGRTVPVLAREFRAIAQARPRLRKNVLHVSLRLAKKDRALRDDEWEQIAKRWALGMKVEVYVAVCHGDHIHIACSRIRTDGSVVSDSHDFKRGEELVRKIEIEFRLIPTPRSHLTDPGAYLQHRRAPGRGAIEMMQRTGRMSAAIRIQIAIDGFLRAGGGDIDDLEEHLRDRDIRLLRNLTADGRLYGLSYTIEMTRVSWRALGHGYKLNNLLKKGLKYDHDRRAARPGRGATGGNGERIALATGERSAGDRADHPAASGGQRGSRGNIVGGQQGAGQAGLHGIDERFDASDSNRGSEVPGNSSLSNEGHDRKRNGADPATYPAGDRRPGRAGSEIIAPLDMADGAHRVTRGHGMPLDHDGHAQKRRSDFEGSAQKRDLDRNGGSPARGRIDEGVQGHAPARQADRGQLASTDAGAAELGLSVPPNAIQRTLAGFFAAFPKGSQFQLVVRPPTASPKRHILALKDLLAASTRDALQNAAEGGGTCRGGPILRDAYLVAPMTEGQVAALRLTGLEIFTVLQTGAYRHAAWVRDPDKAHIGSFDEPSSKLRKILRTIGDFTISRTGDIPGFAVVSSRNSSAGRKSGSGDTFICMQVQPAPVAKPDKATSPPIEVPQTKAGQDGAERVQKVSSARIRL
jgi:hypothetical protein